MMENLKNKSILIVGASSGIGAKTAQVLSEHGSNVVLVARREEQLQQVCNSIGNSKASYYVADVSDSSKIGDLVDRIIVDNGRLDGMVYSAGIVDDVPLRFLDYNRLLTTFNVNYFSFVEFVRQISKRKNFNRGMRIVAISSVSSLLGEKAHTAYSASKAAMDATIRCLAKELWDKGIALNSVQPGMINTHIYKSFVEKTGEDGIVNDTLEKSQYAGLGEPSDVANVVAFLLSSEARFITGVSLPVDGGASTSA